MKKYLSGFMSAVIICSILVFSFMALAAADEVIATLRPDIAIYMDGVKMDYKDVNGNSVTPVIINGSTYLPLRALVSSVGKDVDWSEATQTITIKSLDATTETPATTTTGTQGPTSLLDVTGNIVKSTESNLFSKVMGEENLTFPQIGDSGVKYTSAIKVSGLNYSVFTYSCTIPLNGSFDTLETTLLAISNEPADKLSSFKIRFRIYDADKEVAIVDKTLSFSELEQVTADITGVKTLKFELLKMSGNPSVYGDKYDAYFLNPTVK